MAKPGIEPETGHDVYEPSQESHPLDSETTEKDVKDPGSAEPLNDTSSQYYHGRRLAIVVISVLFATFLVALDNVSSHASPKTASVS